MTAQTNIDNINEYVLNFMADVFEQDMDIQEITSEWYENEFQQKLKELVMNVAKTMIPKEKKEKSPKDPNKPKRGKSAYILFCAEERENVKNELPSNTKPTEITRELGVRWKALSASKKKKDVVRVERLKSEATKDRQRYNDEMEDYQPPSEDELLSVKKGKKKEKKKEKDPDEPKRPRSAYIFYCTDMRDEIKKEMEKAGEDTKGTNVTRKLGEGWKVLSGDDSPNKELYESFVDKAKADKERYDNEMKIYKSGKGVTEEEETDKKSGKKKDTSKKKKSDKKDTKKKSDKKVDKVKKDTGYSVFCKANRAHIKENYPEMSAVNITKELSKMWKNLSKDDKNAWMNAALHKEEEVEKEEEEVEEEEVEKVEEEEVEEEEEEEEEEEVEEEE